MQSYFNRFNISLTKKEAESASHPGDCGPDVKSLLELPKVKRQLSKISDIDLFLELSEYGSWNEEELKSQADNDERIIWIAAGNIAEDV